METITLKYEAMTILGAILDKSSVVSIDNDIARFEISKPVSDMILSHFGEFDPQKYICDVYIDMISSEIAGVRIISLDDDSNFAEDIMFEEELDLDNTLYKITCEHLVCMAKKELY